MADVKIHINFRDVQRQMYEERARFSVRCLHRRAGKTMAAIIECFISCMQSTSGDFRTFYVGPSYRQVKRLAWDYAKKFSSAVPGVQINEAELRIDYPNGSRLQLLGCEQYDTLRGLYADAVAIDECAQVPGAAWTQVIRPMLSDRKGWAILMGTPKGRHNLMWDFYDYAKNSGDPDWSLHVFKASETGILSPAELKSMRRELSDAEYMQEFECSFDAAIRGAFYAKEMSALTDRGQVTQVKYDKTAPVYASLDLGYSDLLVAHFIQPVGTEHHFIGTRAYQETSIPDMLNDWKKLPFTVDTICAPHDARNHSLQTGMTREDAMRSYGYDVQVAERVKSKHEGIEEVRKLLPHCWFDKDECKTTVEACFNYHSDYDEVRRVMKLSPVHDWSSHYVDAIQTYALIRPSRTDWSQYPSGVSPSKSVRF